MDVDPTTLYSKDAAGTIRFWRIEAIDFEIIITHGVVGGEEQEKTEEVEEGLAGRSQEDQVLSRINSRIGKKKDKGYVTSIDAAVEGSRGNALGLARPMLARKFKDIHKRDLSQAKLDIACFQYKYDGHRCLITKQHGRVIAYSRNGKLMTSIGHIIDSMIIPEGVTLDGELYHHGTHLQTISSWVKRKQASTLKLKYMCYDAMVPGNYLDRLAILETIHLGDNAMLAPTTVGGTTYAGINLKLAEARRLGYEGLIIRPHGYKYEDGKRSKGLIKVKTWMDDEFRVVRIEASADGWAVLRCALNDDTGRTFGVSAPGDMPTRERTLTNKEDFIGKSVKVEFACYTVEKKPFHPVAICWREKGEE